MTDEQRSGMEADEAVRGRPFTEDPKAGDRDTEGHGVRFRPFTDDEQGSGMEADEGIRVRPFTEDQPLDETADAEGHGIRWRPAKDDEQAGSETGTENPEGDTEGHGARIKFETATPAKDEPIEPDEAGRFKF